VPRLQRIVDADRAHESRRAREHQPARVEQRQKEAEQGDGERPDERVVTRRHEFDDGHWRFLAHAPVF
jgi:hypothetical protein